MLRERRIQPRVRFDAPSTACRPRRSFQVHGHADFILSKTAVPKNLFLPCEKHFKHFFGKFVEYALPLEVSILNGQPIEVFATYHTSATGVNCAVSKLYDAAHIEPCISQKARVLADRGSVDAFLARYAVNRPNDAESRGMRVLLAHWLDIGFALRNAYSSV